MGRLETVWHGLAAAPEAGNEEVAVRTILEIVGEVCRSWACAAPPTQREDETMSDAGTACTDVSMPELPRMDGLELSEQQLARLAERFRAVEDRFRKRRRRGVQEPVPAASPAGIAADAR